MSPIRQDAWSTDEDLILAEVVLRHIREGGTQLAAFEEVGDRLSRTSAACGFRWNSAIRKKYESAIALARKQRNKGRKPGETVKEENWEEEVSNEMSPSNDVVDQALPLKVSKPAKDRKLTITMEQVLEFLTDYHHQKEDASNIEELEQLKQENQLLKDRLAKLEDQKKTMTEDYRALLSIMERARNLSIYQDSRELIEPRASK
ncbi:RsfA family transcriptional regulator [Bacillus solitudinis]|uniref:RsfA family transcriptional regulator n=1 Tax=Bacillus solitudinis TaxID=2014074 RepID=UPI000C2332E0|nr:RsfA family transcriptional regulator [Bacillus solitudinis]